MYNKRLIMLEFFLVFTSAFNTMKIHILVANQRFSFLIAHKDGNMSGTIILNTGAPQGAILSPLLFSLYINEFKIKKRFSVFLNMLMALVGLLSV